MYLLSQRSVPFTAQKDIKVVVPVKMSNDCSLITPYQKMTVVPGSIMIAGGEKQCESYNNFKYKISRNHIYSAIAESGLIDRCLVYNIVAYIPKGAKYYVNQFMKFILSEKLVLGHEIMMNNELMEYDIRNEVTLPIVRDVLGAVDRTTVSPGWIVLSDKTFIHPLDYDSNMTAIGVVCAIRDGKALITALEQKELRWHYENIKPVNKPIINEKIALNDMKGREYTKRIADLDEYEYYAGDSYEAVRYCVKYKTEGTEEGGWYLPSTGELALMYFHDLDVINATLTLLGKKIIHSWYWASAEHSTTNAWCCDMETGFLGDSNKKWPSCYVRPSYDLLIKD